MYILSFTQVVNNEIDVVVHGKPPAAHPGTAASTGGSVAVSVRGAEESSHMLVEDGGNGVVVAAGASAATKQAGVKFSRHFVI